MKIDEAAKRYNNSITGRYLDLQETWDETQEEKEVEEA
jgi:hypothetical protein